MQHDDFDNRATLTAMVFAALLGSSQLKYLELCLQLPLHPHHQHYSDCHLSTACKSKPTNQPRSKPREGVYLNTTTPPTFQEPPLAQPPTRPQVEQQPRVNPSPLHGRCPLYLARTQRLHLRPNPRARTRAHSTAPSSSRHPDNGLAQLLRRRPPTATPRLRRATLPSRPRHHRRASSHSRSLKESPIRSKVHQVVIQERRSRGRRSQSLSSATVAARPCFRGYSGRRAQERHERTPRSPPGHELHVPSRAHEAAHLQQVVEGVGGQAHWEVVVSFFRSLAFPPCQIHC